MNPYDFYITPEDYEFAAANGICARTLEARIRRFGWDKQRAMTEAPQKRNRRSKWVEIAIQHGIRPDTFYARVNVHGWDEERAAITPPHPNPIELAAAARRKIPKEMVVLAKKNGIPFGTFKSRIYQSGWDVMRAATEPVWSKAKVDAYGVQRFKEKYGENPNLMLFPHRGRRDDSYGEGDESMNENLKPCPFCGGEAKITVSDDEGNNRDAEYENDPWSGLSFRIFHAHEDNKGCPIALYEMDGVSMGVYLYDSREEAADAWNKRQE